MWKKIHHSKRCENQIENGQYQHEFWNKKEAILSKGEQCGIKGRQILSYFPSPIFPCKIVNVLIMF